MGDPDPPAEMKTSSRVEVFGLHKFRL